MAVGAIVARSQGATRPTLMLLKGVWQAVKIEGSDGCLNDDSRQGW